MSRYRDAWAALPRVQHGLLALLGGAVVLANVRQPYPAIAPLQHAPTVALLLAAPPLLARWPLSTRGVGLLTGFFLLHTLAGRYTYSNVPYDDWSRALTGRDVTETFGLARNGFDRVVHLAFGLLWAPALAEAGRRHWRLGRIAASWVAFLFVGAASALYEIFEWLLTGFVDPAVAADYNGQQGDMWDSQKDMAMAILGAGAAMFMAALRRPADR